MRTSNPALNSKTFSTFSYADTAGRAMTIQGTIHKSGVLLILLLITSIFSWKTAAASSELTGTLLPLGGIGGFIIALVTCFNAKWAPFTAPVYALLEGLFLGAISYLFESHYANIVINAVMLTFGTMIAMLMAYRSGLIKVTEKFKAGVIAATGAIMFVYALSFILRLFSISMPFIHDAGPIGITVSLVIVVVAALNLVLDFDLIKQGAERGAPRYMEWYGAFALMVTLIWLYLEILRLLSKLNRR